MPAAVVPDDEEWRYVRLFMEMDKLPLVDEYKTMPASLRVYMRHDYPPTAEELARPARVQIDRSVFEKTAYMEGEGSLNLWYGPSKMRPGEGSRREKIPAKGHCYPLRDAGYTAADMVPTTAPPGAPLGSNSPHICIYFAKGICHKGSSCKFKHRVPTLYDNDKLSLGIDIFGREKFAQMRDDFSGVGSINHPCTSIWVSDWLGDPGAVCEEDLRRSFGVYGAIKQISVHQKTCATIEFCYRAAAEFALVAMKDWKLSSSKTTKEILTLRWAK